MAFKVATKEKARLRLNLSGPSGSGKTMTALKIARAMVGPKGKIGLIDSERGSASKYADQFRFAVDELENYSPMTYIEKIMDADLQGFDILIIDSLSHAWFAKDGALEMVDKAAARSNSKNSFAAWREVTPIHNQLVDTILKSRMHIITTMRAKTAYVQEKDDKGNTTIRKLGMESIQREGMEYEFDVTGDMDLDNRLVISKSRCSALAKQVFKEPGEEVAKILLDWLNGPTAEDAVTYVQSEVDTCFSVEDLSGLKRLLVSKGGAYYTDAVKDILRAKFEQLKPPATETTTPPAAAAAAPVTAEAPSQPPIHPAAAGTPTLEQALTHIDRLLTTAKDYDAIRQTRETCASLGGAYEDPKVTELINLKYFELFPEESSAKAVA